MSDQEEWHVHIHASWDKDCTGNGIYCTLGSIVDEHGVPSRYRTLCGVYSDKSYYLDVYRKYVERDKHVPCPTCTLLLMSQDATKEEK